MPLDDEKSARLIYLNGTPAALFFSFAKSALAGRLGVDAVAFVSMSGALLLGENLAGVVVAVMYAGGNILEDFAVAARLVHKAGGSLRDVQLLAGHRSIQTTQRYIDGDSDVQRKLVAMI